MKRLLYISTIIVVALSIYSCDKITNPIINKGGGSVITPVTPPTHVDSTTFTDDALLKVLVEDYTAHHCTNCPAASKECEDLLASLPANNLPQCIFMECNVSNLANSYGPSPTFCWNDYINLADSNWNNTFIDGNSQMPGTMVDRIYYDGTAGGKANLYGHFNVATVFDSLVGINPVATMNQTVNIHIVDSMYAPPTSTLAMDITTKLLAPNTNNKYYMVVALVEDSIYDDQDSLGNLVPYYLKRMTVRAAVNANGSGWGDTLSAYVAGPQTLHYTYANVAKFVYNSHVAFPPPPKSQAMWNMAHMHVVAFVYQRTSGVNNYLVLQVQRLHL